MMPALFVAHGSPMIAIETSAYGDFLDQFAKSLPKPAAVVVFSAHWESAVQQISAVSTYDTIYDFGGFPDALYQVTYPAPGHPQLAEAIQRSLRERGLAAEIDRTRGLDHGAWTILTRLFPEANVPVVAMSVNAGLPPEEQFRVGQALTSFRDQDVLVLGSGVTVHNFQILWARENPKVQEDVMAFQGWLDERIRAWDLDALFDYARQAPNARLAVPENGQEHFAPLFYILGAAGSPKTIEVLHESWMWNVMANVVFRFA